MIGASFQSQLPSCLAIAKERAYKVLPKAIGNKLSFTSIEGFSWSHGKKNTSMCICTKTMQTPDNAKLKPTNSTSQAYQATLQDYQAYCWSYKIWYRRPMGGSLEVQGLKVYGWWESGGTLGRSLDDIFWWNSGGVKDILEQPEFSGQEFE
ncbi:hypothetical protein BDR05DRAFT_948816 [Suillus weaverae]|nr:hypothetical protein BDR05DRAFT_948816 [Suillus weaverae]